MQRLNCLAEKPLFMPKEYAFITRWQIRAPLPVVWDTIHDSVQWPSWWKGVLDVKELHSGAVNGIGSVREYTWKSVLPYRLVFNMKLTAVQPYQYLRGEAFGELEGMGEWFLEEKEGITQIQYNWNVFTNKAWMNTLSFILKPVFEYNHNIVMAWGAKGLAKKLNADLISY